MSHIPENPEASALLFSVLRGVETAFHVKFEAELGAAWTTKIDHLYVLCTADARTPEPDEQRARERMAVIGVFVDDQWGPASTLAVRKATFDHDMAIAVERIAELRRR